MGEGIVRELVIRVDRWVGDRLNFESQSLISSPISQYSTDSIDS